MGMARDEVEGGIRMIIEVHANYGYAGTNYNDEFEIEDDATEERIDECAFEMIMSRVDWYWDKKEAQP